MKRGLRALFRGDQNEAREILRPVQEAIVARDVRHHIARMKCVRGHVGALETPGEIRRVDHLSKLRVPIDLEATIKSRLLTHQIVEVERARTLDRKSTRLNS